MSALGFRPNLDGYADASIDLLRHIGARTEIALGRNRRRLDELRSPLQVRDYQGEVRDAVLHGVGGLPALDPVPPAVTWLGRKDLESYNVERLIFESSPSVPVTASLYRPCHAGPEPVPAVLFVCGHTAEGKADPAYQVVCAGLAAAGLAVLVFDPWGQGERLGYLGPDGSEVIAGGTAEHTYAGLQMWWLGQSPARYFVHDARRALDVLAALPDVDSSRMGITGNSGGGMLCTLMMSLEPRLAAAAVGTYVTSRADYLWTGKHQDAEQVLLEGTRNGVDHADLLAAMAPRPVAVLAADYDFFPIEGTTSSVDRARHAYGLLGDTDRLRLVRAPTTHGYGSELAAAAVAFFVDVLGAGGGTGEMPEPTALPPEQLRCTRTGQVALDHPDARFLHDLHLAELEDRTPPAPEEAVAWVRDRVLRDRRPPAPTLARWLPGPHGSVHGIWRSEEDLWGAGVLVPPPSGNPAEVTAVRILLLDGGTSQLRTDHTVLEQGQHPQLCLALDVRGPERSCLTTRMGFRRGITPGPPTSTSATCCGSVTASPPGAPTTCCERST